MACMPHSMAEADWSEDTTWSSVAPLVGKVSSIHPLTTNVEERQIPAKSFVIFFIFLCDNFNLWLEKLES